MSGQYGVDQLKKLVGSVADVLNVVSKLIHKGGILSLFGLLDPLNVLKAVDFDMVLKELKELDAGERASVEQEFKSRLALQNPSVQLKVIGSVSALEDSVALVNEALQIVDKGKAIVARVKALFFA